MSEERTLPPDREKRIEAELRSLPSSAPAPDFQDRLRSMFAAGELTPTLPRDAEEDPAAEGFFGESSGRTGAFGDVTDRARVTDISDLAAERGATSGGDANRSSLGDSGAPNSGTSSQGDPIPLDFGTRRAKKPRPSWRFWLVPAVAAAAVLLLYFVRPTPPVVSGLDVAAQGNGTLRVGTRDFPIAEVEQYASLLEPGTKILVQGDMSAEIHMTVEDDFRLVAIAGAEFTVPYPAKKGRNSFLVDMGEVRVATLPGIDGEAIEIGAPGTRVDVMGTTLAVIADTSSTCVCLLEGTAMMKMKNGDMHHLEEGMRTIMHMDPETPDETAPIFGNERMKLEMLRTAVGPSK
ncbi:MAG: hypothetical protein H6682_04390 [Candidatus Eisenbacteria bacterium]|nr:hypothetical protein [Candidatus Eisenbacteria bacterium]